MNEQGCLYFSSTAAAATSGAHIGGRDRDPVEATHPNPGLHSPKESSVDTCKAHCACAPGPKASGIRRKQACIRSPDGVSYPIIKNFILALLTLGIEQLKPVTRQTRLGRGRGTLIANFMGFTSCIPSNSPSSTPSWNGKTKPLLPPSPGC